MEITLDYSNLYTIVARSLSIIGKRSVDDNGTLLFRDITLGSREHAIINDYFNNAFVVLCSELGQFITAEINSVSGLSQTAYIDFWVDDDPANHTDGITATGQLLYNYATRKLYSSSLSIYFASVSSVGNPIYVNGGTYYHWRSGALAQLTEEEMEALTEAQRAAAVTLDYYDVDPLTLSPASAGLLLYYNGALYKSVRRASFSETALSGSTAYVAPDGLTYEYAYGALQRSAATASEAVSLTLTMPDNWNSALLFSFRLALNNYCTSYALYSWFTVTAPRLSQKYAADAQSQLDSARLLIHEKTAPAGATGDVPTPTSTVSNI